MEQLVQDSLFDKTSVLEKYSTPEYGYNMDVYETIIFAVAVIQGIESVLNIIETLSKKGVSSKDLIDSASENLQKMYSLSAEKIRRLDNLLQQWLEQ